MGIVVAIMKLAAIGIAMAAVLPACRVRAQTYTFLIEHAPDNGSETIEAVTNYNDLLSLVIRSGKTTCTLVKGSQNRVIQDPKAAPGTTYCYGVTRTHSVIGYYLMGTTATVGFIWRNGVYSDFTVAGASVAQGGTQLTAASTQGIFAGAYADSNGYYHAFTTHGGGAIHAVVVPNAKYLIPVGVNNKSQVVVQSFDINNNLLACYLVAGSKVTTIAYPGSSRTIAHAVDSKGNVVGHYSDSQGVQHGFIFHSASGSYTGPIDAPASYGGTVLIGLNDAGKVVGSTAPDANGIRKGLVGTPGK